MKTERAMPLEVGAYLQDTTGLSRAEHGSYMLLIMAYWANGGPLPSDDKWLQFTARCPDHEWIRTKGLMAKFFDCGNGVWRHKRIDEEIEKSKRRIAISAMGVKARRDLGHLPSVQPSGEPSVEPTVPERIGMEKQLERVEKRLEELRNQAVRTATETRYSVPQREEMKVLKERQAELRHLLKYVA